MTMSSDPSVLKHVQAALQVETRLGFNQHPIHLQLQEGALTLEGEAATLAAKRLAVRLARGIAGVARVHDRLSVVPAERKGDGEILDGFAAHVLRHSEFRNCTLRRYDKGQAEFLHEAHGDTSGEIVYGVADGVVMLDGNVISLSHRRLAEVLAWWSPGVRNVVNRLTIVPPEQDNDDEINDAVRLALEMDPLVHADQISVNTTLGAVALDGIVVRRSEREMAEFDTWCVPGVNDVINRVAVQG
jgi:osmotically-inducible protein OsmY